LVIREKALHQRAIADVAFDEPIVRMIGDRGERVEITGVGEFVEVDEAAFASAQPLADEAAPNEAGAARDEDAFHVCHDNRPSAGLAPVGRHEFDSTLV
jgi:hypothetical protein